MHEFRSRRENRKNRGWSEGEETRVMVNENVSAEVEQAGGVPHWLLPVPISGLR